MPYQSLAEAGAAVGRNRSTILKAIRKGTISATRDEATGGWLIEPAELHRVFPPVDVSTPGNGLATADNGELRELRARLHAAEAATRNRDETIADLRRRLDTAAGQLSEALAQVRLLTDQRSAPRRAWWPWRRG